MSPAGPSLEDTDNAPAAEVGEVTETPPRVTVESLTFSDGTKLELGRTDIVAPVGPNNAGKSAALREIALSFRSASTSNNRVVTAVQIRKEGTEQQLIALLRRHSRARDDAANFYGGLGYRVRIDLISHVWTNDLGSVSELFLRLLGTETRITDSNDADSISVLDHDPTHPIHLLYSDEQLEHRISSYFRRAFGKDLIVYRGGGSRIPLMVGDRPELLAGENLVSASYLRRVREQAEPLQKQGDGMRSFATIILHLLAVQTPSVLILDEPEAFLHPPQARLIGEFIARERPPESQLLIATHSPDVLMGLLATASTQLRVVRLQRDGPINHAKELDKAKAADIGSDPLMKFSGVISGVFHERVIIAESDADAMFYGALLDLPSVHGEVAPDVLFVQSGGKHRMANLAGALRALGVPVDVIVDIDVLNDEATFRRMVESVGGDWDIVKSDALPLKQAIESHKPWLNSREVKSGIEGILSKAPRPGSISGRPAFRH